MQLKDVGTGSAAESQWLGNHGLTLFCNELFVPPSILAPEKHCCSSARGCPGLLQTRWALLDAGLPHREENKTHVWKSKCVHITLHYTCLQLQVCPTRFTYSRKHCLCTASADPPRTGSEPLLQTQLSNALTHCKRPFDRHKIADELRTENKR